MFAVPLIADFLVNVVVVVVVVVHHHHHQVRWAVSMRD